MSDYDLHIDDAEGDPIAIATLTPLDEDGPGTEAVEKIVDAMSVAAVGENWTVRL